MLPGIPEPAMSSSIIEVADSSLDYDRDIKRPMYAEAGITEYWIVNLVDDCLEVYRGPRPDGTYQDERILRRGESTDIARPARRGRRRGRDPLNVTRGRILS